MDSETDAANADDLASWWEALLSADPARVRRAWRDLTDDEALAALEHLRKMATEPDWAPPQQQAAAEALRLIKEQTEN